MKKIYKLVLKSYLGPMILTFFIVMFVLMMNFLWRYIDELVGKGLTFDVISELIFWASMNLIPMGLPLATLLAAIMTMGNLGENYELLAMKSAGMSLPKIMRPLLVVVGMVAVASFFVANNLVPYATEKMFTMIHDIRKQKQALEFKDGAFFNGMADEGISIRVGRQDKETGLLRDILIYNNSNASGTMSTTLADSGYIHISDDKNFLVVTLFNGNSYDQNRSYNWLEKGNVQRYVFEHQTNMISMDGFNFGSSSSDLSRNAQTKNITELTRGIDSLQRVVNSSTAKSYEPLLQQYIFTYEPGLVVDSLRTEGCRRAVSVADSIKELDIYARESVMSHALSMASNSQGMFMFDEDVTKDALDQLYRYQVEWHRKVSLPVSIIIFFLIGAPLGAIIRKGGLGMPIVVSVVFFVLYYMVSMTGEKMTREGTWSAITGMWYATFILMPIAIFLTYKATNDSNLFNAEWYFTRLRKIKAFFNKSLKRNYDNGSERKNA